MVHCRAARPPLLSLSIGYKWICLAVLLTSGLAGCGGTTQITSDGRALPPPFKAGQAVAGEGNEVANTDLVIGDKRGPVGVAFANALANQREGHPTLLAVLGPNTAVKPSTVLIPKVTIKDAKQSVHLSGPIQLAVAKAIADSVEEGIIPKGQCDDLVIVCSVFTHWGAEDQKKVYRYNYEAAKLALKRAWAGEPSAEEMLRFKKNSTSPWE